MSKVKQALEMAVGSVGVLAGGGYQTARNIGEHGFNTSLGVLDFANRHFLRDGENLIGKEFNKKGKGVLFGGALLSSIVGANDAYTESRKGVPSGVLTPTPTMDGPSTDYYSDRSAESWGAGGDINFALNSLRQGTGRY